MRPNLLPLGPIGSGGAHGGADVVEGNGFGPLGVPVNHCEEVILPLGDWQWANQIDVDGVETVIGQGAFDERCAGVA